MESRLSSSFTSGARKFQETMKVKTENVMIDAELCDILTVHGVTALLKWHQRSCSTYTFIHILKIWDSFVDGLPELGHLALLKAIILITFFDMFMHFYGCVPDIAVYFIWVGTVVLLFGLSKLQLKFWELNQWHCNANKHADRVPPYICFKGIKNVKWFNLKPRS